MSNKKAGLQSIGSTLTLLQERCEEAAEQKDQDAKKQLDEGYTPEVLEELRTELKSVEGSGKLTPKRGMASKRLSEIGQLDLLEREQRGDFSISELSPGSEYPLILTRAPIFLPTRRSVAAALVDEELSIPFSTGWGEGRKYGPPLTMYDEDTLLALAGLREQCLRGAAHRMPIPTKQAIPFGKPTRVHALYTTIAEIEDFLGKPKGGSGHRRRLESVHRLSNSSIKFTHISDKTVGQDQREAVVSIKLIEMQTVTEGNESFLYVQFPPEMAYWLEKSVAYIDMNVRRELTDNGKAIHKHLSGQSTFNIFAETLRTVTKSQLTKKRFMQELRATMKKLAELGWCEYELVGNGRSKPHKLTGRRLKRS